MKPAVPRVSAALWPLDDGLWCADASRTLKSVVGDLLMDSSCPSALREGLGAAHNRAALRRWRDEISKAWWDLDAGRDELLSVRVLHREGPWAARADLDDEPEALPRIAVLLQLLDYFATGMRAEQTLIVRVE